VRACLDELLADREAARYSKYMLGNRGGVPFAVCPRGDGSLPSSLDQAALKADILAQFAGNGAFQPLVINRPVDFHDFHYSPEELNVSGTTQKAEARFCAVIGISPMVLDLPVGLEHSTYSNKESALRAAWTDLVVPTMNYIAGELREQLLGEFYVVTEDLWVAFDYSEVKALLEDENAMYARATMAYEKGWLKRSDVRAQAGFTSEPEDDIYKPLPAEEAQDPRHALARDDYQAGLITVNEARAMVDYPALPEGNELRVPQELHLAADDPPDVGPGGKALAIKRLDVWDDREIAEYFRKLAPEKYDGLITAGRTRDGREADTQTTARPTAAERTEVSVT
jgi:hypothetical protein